MKYFDNISWDQHCFGEMKTMRILRKHFINDKCNTYNKRESVATYEGLPKIIGSPNQFEISRALNN